MQNASNHKIESPSWSGSELFVNVFCLLEATCVPFDLHKRTRLASRGYCHTGLVALYSQVVGSYCNTRTRFQGQSSTRLPEVKLIQQG